jgi:hypothetical protein
MATASPNWDAGPTGPKTVDELRKTLTALAKRRRVSS